MKKKTKTTTKTMDKTEKKWEAKTRNGYDLFEVISTLQKEIRRGKVVESMFWGLELMESHFHKYLWRRLKVIANEDIGVANPVALIVVEVMATQFEEFLDAGKEGSARLCLANAILILCNGKKTRASDDLQGAVRLRRDQGWKLEIPDYALDKHTKRGRQMGRSWEHWFNEGCYLENEDTSINKWKDKANELRKSQPPKPKVMKNLFEAKTEEEEDRDNVDGLAD